MNNKVDEYLAKSGSWQETLAAIRTLLLSSGLHEEVKWGSPTYTHQGGNVIGIRGFKDYCSMWFFKGSLVHDPQGLLIVPGENTQANRHLRFTSVQEVLDQEANIRDLIRDAIRVEEAGEKVEFKTQANQEIPEEFQNKLNTLSALKEAFEKLTPGRQREYARYFSEPKQAKTRASRIEKCVDRILAGQGLNDRYRC